MCLKCITIFIIKNNVCKNLFNLRVSTFEFDKHDIIISLNLIISILECYLCKIKIIVYVAILSFIFVSPQTMRSFN